MVEREDGSPPERGSLWRLNRSDQTAPLALRDGITISNSIAFSPEGDRMYFADSPTQKILVFPLDPEFGSLGKEDVFAELSGNAYPDGSDVDAQGRLWNAEWANGRITAYNPDGSVAARLDLPVSQPTCIAFGGPELDLLFVTSAREDLAEVQLAEQPDAGNVLVYRSTASGLPTPLFSGD